jgi:hypothetical protein
MIFHLLDKTQIGYQHANYDSLWIFRGMGATLAVITKETVFSLLLSMLLLTFWLSYLRSRINNDLLLISLFAFFVVFMGLQFIHVRPSYIALLCFIPLAVIWAWFAFRTEPVTVFIALVLVNVALTLSFMGQMPEGFTSMLSVSYASGLILLFILGVFFTGSKVKVSDFEYYIPAYVSRIAEKERFLNELAIARQVQQNFLPQASPELPSLDIASICKPAREVGGDYFDFIQHNNGSLGVVIGDVSGKGVSAAFYMTMTKGIIKTLSRTVESPKELLSRMNQIFYENVPNGVFISVVYAVFDQNAGKLCLARAGHNPVIRMNGHASPEFVVSRGLAIGLDSGDIFTKTIEEIELQLTGDDTFVFYTDGISESMNSQGEEYGEERLLECINKCRDCDSQQLIDRVVLQVSRFSDDTNQHDDLTMVVVKVKAVHA